MKKLLYYLKLVALMLLMTMAAFGVVVPVNLNTRKRYADKEITVEMVESGTQTESQFVDVEEDMD